MKKANGRRVFIWACLAAGSALVGVLARGWSNQRVSRAQLFKNANQDLTVRDIPIAIPSDGQLSRDVSVQDVREFLLTLGPHWMQQSKVDTIIHAFRLWGPNAVFPDQLFRRAFPDRHFWSGSEMDGLFRSTEEYLRVFERESPLLFTLSDGIVCRTAPSSVPGSSNGALVHDDKLLRTFASLGYSSTTPLVAMRAVTRDPESGVFEHHADLVQGTIRDLIRGSVNYFVVEQELEWTVESLCRYLAPCRSWTNRFGDRFTFDGVAEKLLSRPYGVGSCQGLHVLYAMTVLLRVDDVCEILSVEIRRRIESHLLWSRELERRQVQDGTFTEVQGSKSVPDLFEDRSDWISRSQIVFISHNLEWISLAPEELRPRHEVVVNAARALMEGLRPWSMYSRSGEYAPLSHAGSALCSLIGKTPTEICQE